MQFPEPSGVPDGGGPVASFLDSYLRGNRDEDQRKSESSVAQALNQMNDPLVMNRIRSKNTAQGPSILMRALTGTDDTLVGVLYLNVLSRYPADDEKQTALQSLPGTTGATRVHQAANLL